MGLIITIINYVDTSNTYLLLCRSYSSLVVWLYYNALVTWVANDTHARQDAENYWSSKCESWILVCAKETLHIFSLRCTADVTLDVGAGVSLKLWCTQGLITDPRQLENKWLYFTAWMCVCVCVCVLVHLKYPPQLLCLCLQTLLLLPVFLTIFQIMWEKQGRETLFILL